MRIYICHSLGLTEYVSEEVDKLIEEGHAVYFPAIDSPQGESVKGEVILQANYEGMEDAEVVYVYWDGVSQGTLFDLGMAYALGIPIEFKHLGRTWTSFARDQLLEQKVLRRMLGDNLPGAA